jgi:hypothetical protein
MAACAFARREVSKISGGSQLKEFVAQEDAPGLKWQHIAAATIGNALEFYDFLTYALFSIHNGHAFFPARVRMGV